MRRGLLLSLLLLSLFWQAVAHAAPAAAAGHQPDAEHAALHWQQQAHHHHDDGTWAADDSDESRQHVGVDSAVTAGALPGPAGWRLAPAARTAPAVFHPVTLPSPALEGPRRPPRPFA
jgi:Ni/Co efflux regulator RcnB